MSIFGISEMEYLGLVAYLLESLFVILYHIQHFVHLSMNHVGEDPDRHVSVQYVAKSGRLYSRESRKRTTSR